MNGSVSVHKSEILFGVEDPEVMYLRYRVAKREDLRSGDRFVVEGLGELIVGDYNLWPDIRGYKFACFRIY